MDGSRFERLLEWLEQYRAAIDAGDQIAIELHNYPHELRHSFKLLGTIK